MPADNGLGLDGLCDYRYEVALGDAVLTEAELRELARLKAPLVRTKGRWVELRREDLEAAFDLLRRQRTSPPPPLSALDLVRLGLGLAPAELPVVAMEATGWLGELLSADGAGFAARPTPAGFCGELRPYQQRGLGWLAWLDHFGLGACLADDMGLGKTAQLLGLLLLERESCGAAHEGPERVRPSRGATGKAHGGKTVPSELARPHAPCLPDVGGGQLAAGNGTFCPVATRARSPRSGSSHRRRFCHGRGGGRVGHHYVQLAGPRPEMFASVPWRRLVLDEAQYVKNPETRLARAARALPARRKVALTGTPVENRLSELWSIMDILNPGLLGGRKTFRQRFSVPIEREGNEEAARLLRRVTQPFVLRRVKTDSSIISDLPDKLEMKVFCNLTREQATLYQAVVDDMLARMDESDGMKRKGIVLASLTKLKQVCNHPAQLLGDGSSLPGRSGKLSQLEDVVDDVVEMGERLLCFTQFAEMGVMVRDHLQARLAVAVPFLHGGVSQPEARRHGRGLPGRGGGPGTRPVAESGWCGAQFDGGEPRRALRPVVEPRRQGTGNRPCFPHRAASPRPGAQIRVRGDRRRTHRCHDRTQTRSGGTHRGQWGGIVHELSTEQIREIVALSPDAVAG